MVMVVNSGRWCLGFLGDAGFPDHLKLWLRIHGDEELGILKGLPGSNQLSLFGF